MKELSISYQIELFSARAQRLNIFRGMADYNFNPRERKLLRHALYSTYEDLKMLNQHPLAESLRNHFTMPDIY